MSVMLPACVCTKQVNCVHDYSEMFQMHWNYSHRSTFDHSCTHSDEEETTILWVTEPLEVE